MDVSAPEFRPGGSKTTKVQVKKEKGFFSLYNYVCQKEDKEKEMNEQVNYHEERKRKHGNGFLVEYILKDQLA